MNSISHIYRLVMPSYANHDSCVRRSGGRLNNPANMSPRPDVLVDLGQLGYLFYS